MSHLCINFIVTILPFFSFFYLGFGKDNNVI